MPKIVTAFLLFVSTLSGVFAQFPDRYNHYRSIPQNNSIWQNALEHYATENLDSALAFAQIAQQEFQRNRQWDNNLFIANFCAQILGESGKPQEALNMLAQARLHCKDNLDTLTSAEYAENLILTGRVYTLLNSYTQSEKFFTRAAVLLEHSGKYPEIRALAHFTLWQLYNKMMNSELAYESISKAIEVLNTAESDYAEAILYFIQADRLDKNQLYLKAELFMAAANAFEQAGSVNDFMYYTTLMKITQQFSSFQSDYTLAKHYGNLAEQYTIKNRMSRAKSYGLNFALGDLYRSFDHYHEALPYFTRAKEITEDIFGKQSLEYITACLYLGRLYRFMNKFEKASVYLNTVYNSGKAGWKGRFPHEFTLYGEFGRLYSSWNKPDSALLFAQKRLAYEHQGKSFDLHEIPPTPRTSSIPRYYNSMRVKIEAYKLLYQQTNDTTLLSLGLKHCSYAIELIDIMNDKALEEKSGLKNSNRAKLIASHAIFFSLELNKHREREENIKSALYFSERSNANYLKYLLSTKYIDEDLANSEEILLKNSIDEIDLKLRHELSLIHAQYDSLHKISLNKKLQLANIVLSSRAKSSGIDADYRLNPKIPKFNLDSIQKRLPDDGAILVYHIDNYEDDGEEPSSKEISKHKRLVTFYIDRNGIYCKQNQFTPHHENAIVEFLRGLKTGDMQTYLEMGIVLHQLLIEPINHLLSSKKNLIIIPDAAFADIPLESLPINRNGNTICEKLSTSYHYSLGLWSISNQKNATLQLKSLAAFAPQFSSGKQKNNLISRRSSKESKPNSQIYLAQLPMAETEVIQISKLFSTSKEKTVQVEHNRITKQEFVTYAPNFDIIHIASHGFADVRDFRNSGIYFSNPSKNGHELLHLNEIYNLDLKANLVVLSACKTNVGKIVQGEGSMALPRGFIYAGVPNVIASLWKVHDEKTMELMVAFYQHLLKGNSYAEALRLAKLDCIAKGYLPLDWAGFVLIGG